LAQSRTKINTNLLIKIASLTWGVYDANRSTALSMLSNTQKTYCKSIQPVKSYRLCVGTSHKVLERLDTQRDNAVSQLAMKGLILASYFPCFLDKLVISAS
jgi:hypothetical protein